MFDQLLQLLDLYLVQLQLLLLLFQDQQLPLLLLPLLVQLLVYHRYLFLPVLLDIFLLPLQVLYLLLKLLYHLRRYDGLHLLTLLLLFVLGQLLLHLLNLVLLGDVLFVVPPQYPLILHQLFVKLLGLVFDFGQLGFELRYLRLVLSLVLHRLQSLVLLSFDF